MKFDSVKLDDALGHILAHSVVCGKSTLKKGTRLGADDLAKLDTAGHDCVTVAMLEAEDAAENAAAQNLAKAFLTADVTMTEAYAGRVNLLAGCDGVLTLNVAAIEAFNAVDEAITIATLPNFARVKKGTLLATLKIIPYGVAQARIDRAVQVLGQGALRVCGFSPQTCDLVLTRTKGFKPSLLAKAETVLRARIAPLHMSLQTCEVVAHTEVAVAAAIKRATSDVVLVLGASATSDRRDVVPAGIISAGGRVIRFGMPVDPGNLLVLGTHRGRAVIGLPGCVRAPALNGADWVLERLCAGLELDAAAIAYMGVGGLLKEIPERIHPRLQVKVPKSGVVAVLLAAGSSARMRGDDKLLRDVGGVQMLRHAVQVALSAKIDQCLVVLKKDAHAHRRALQGLDVQIIETVDADQGMAASLRAGILALQAPPKAVLVGLADMPDLTPLHYNRVIAAHDRAKNRLIVCPTNPDGKRGHPVLFDAKFIENLAGLQGDTGAKEIVKTVPEWVFEVPMDAAVSLDLDTPEAWAVWETAKRTTS